MRQSLQNKPLQSSFLTDQFDKNPQNLEWLKKVNEKYGDSIDKLSYPGNELVIERIIDALTQRNRENEVFSIIDHHLKYYDKYSMNDLLNIKIKNEDILYKYWPIYLYGNDKFGHPIFYDDLLSLDLSKVVEIFSKTANGFDINDINDEDDDKYEHNDENDEKLFDIVRKFRLKFYGKMIKQKELLSKQFDRIIFKHILIMDLNNFGYYKMVSNLSIYSKIAKSVLTDEQLLFPQTCFKIYLINCPWTFRFIWKILTNFIDPITIEKVKILGSDYLNEMLKDIDIEHIPKKYGGKGEKEMTIA